MLCLFTSRAIFRVSESSGCFVFRGLNRYVVELPHLGLGLGFRCAGLRGARELRVSTATCVFSCGVEGVQCLHGAEELCFWTDKVWLSCARSGHAEADVLPKLAPI